MFNKYGQNFDQMLNKKGLKGHYGKIFNVC